MEKRDWQKHLQNETFQNYDYILPTNRSMKNLGDLALCQTSCQGLALYTGFVAKDNELHLKKTLHSCNFQCAPSPWCCEEWTE